MLVNKKYISVKFSESKLKSRNRDLSILLEMSNFLATSMNLKHIFEGALSKVLEYFQFEGGRIYLLDGEGQFLDLAAYQGVQPYGLERESINEGFSGKAVRTKSFIAQHVSELEDKKRMALLLRKGFRIIICVPLIIMDQVRGVMNLATSRETIALNEDKIDLLTAIGNQIAIAANNAKLYEDLNNKIRILEEKKEMIKFFTYAVSHDLKSPAVGIHGLTRRFQEKYGVLLDEKGKTYCDQILKTSENMVALVQKINDYMRTKEAPFRIEKFRLKEITEMIRNEFSIIMESRQINWSEPDLLPEIMGDKMAVSRVFRNFVDNALKYGGDGMMEIRIGYKEDAAFHILSVSDDGIGIKEEDKEKIFERFQRDETSRGIAGSGLGLAIVKETAERHQGRAWMENEKKGVTTFYISISKDLTEAG